MSKRKKNKKYFALFMILVCLCGLVYSTYKVLFWKKSDIENQKIIVEIEEKVVNNGTVDDNETDISVDFDSLMQKNADTVAYLKVKNTKINYAVVKAKDNKYYLTHSFYKKGNAAGWVFADYHNKYDGADRNLVIYGHNMKNGSMFGTLKKTLQKKWYTNKDNQIITLATPDGVHKYQVFSVYSIPVEDYYINTEFKNNDEFYKFLKKIKSRSYYDFKVDLEKTDKILTLSTCNSAGKNRTVLHAKLIK